MYIYIVEKLYKKNPKLLIGKQDEFKITRNSSDFRSPQILQSGYFIETNMDSYSKFQLIKKLLITFELEDELLIKYVDNNTNSSISLNKDILEKIREVFKNMGLSRC